LKRVANPIRAYHGSPYDFDRFDLGKIGTGEGAQTYGHGLYFAENPAVARSYQRTLTRPGGPHSQNVTQASLRAEYEAAGNWPDAVEAAVRRYYAPPKQKEAYRQMLLREGPPPPPDGRMYEVNIHADPDELLDWDKLLSQQPEVLSVVKKIVGSGGQPERWTGGQAYQALADYLGGQTQVAKNVGGGYPVKYADDLKASKVLADAGIPGIRYLDQGSRAGGKGTRNYSIWDEDVIEILRKYGILPSLGAVAAHQIQRDRP